MVIFEPNNLQIEREVITIQNLPQEFKGAKIVHLTDFHSYWFGPREKRVLEIIEKLNPDFVFITGDFVDLTTKSVTDRNLSSVRVFWQELGERYRDRVFAVLGNHDYDIEIKRVGDILGISGIEILSNENKRIFINNEFIYLIGVDDPRTNRDNLEKAMREIQEDRPKILLAHSPDIISEAAGRRIDLVLVGDTQGGQVNIPFLDRFLRYLKPLTEYGRKYISGLFKIDSTYLYVNRGVGTSMLPIRFNCPPEITLIELTPSI